MIKQQIKFKSKNDKQHNLNFKIEGKDREYKELEQMEQDLQGEIKEDKNIIINWQWKYEIDDDKNFQDTQDGEKLENYDFTIYAIRYK